MEPIICHENDQLQFEINVLGNVSNPEMKFFKRGSNIDLKNTYWSGSMSCYGDTILTPYTDNLKSGEWVLSVSADVGNGRQVVLTQPFVVLREGAVMETPKKNDVVITIRCAHCGNSSGRLDSRGNCVSCGAPL